MEGGENIWGWALEEVTIYEPVRFIKLPFVHLEDILTLEQTTIGSMYPYYVEKSDSIKSFFDNLNCNKYSHVMKWENKELPFEYEIVETHELPDQKWLGAFFSALNGDRPYSQFLDFYKLLENQFGKGNESQELKKLLNNKTFFPDACFKEAFEEATKAGSTTVNIKGRDGRWKRETIAKTIYYRIRNRLVHFKRIPKYIDEPSINPFTADEFTAELDFWVVFVRELARHIIHNGVKE